MLELIAFVAIVAIVSTMVGGVFMWARWSSARSRNPTERRAKTMIKKLLLIIASVLLASAVILSANRYEMYQFDGGAYYRLDRVTGGLVMCFPPRGIKKGVKCY